MAAYYPFNAKCYACGFWILYLNKIRYAVKGYGTPRTFSESDINRSVDYGIKVFNSYYSAIEKYTKERSYINGRKILELGPGSDLSVGLLFLASGATRYCAFDANNLLPNTPPSFYKYFFDRLTSEFLINDRRLADLQQSLDNFNDNRPTDLDYVCNTAFDITSLKPNKFDLVVSNAAFEHFEDINKTIRQLSELTGPGAVFIATIDFKTHSRWIRDIDPLNIYRYNDRLYSMVKYRGIPNRVRPHEYISTLKEHGWIDIQFEKANVASAEYLNRVSGNLAIRFKDQAAEMETLSGLLMARRTG